MGILKLERSGAVLGCEDAAEMRDGQADYGVGDLDRETHHLNSPTLRSTGPGSRKCAFGGEGSGVGTLFRGHSAAPSNLCEMKGNRSPPLCSHLGAHTMDQLSSVLTAWPEQVPEPLGLRSSVRASSRDGCQADWEVQVSRWS